MDFGDLKPVKAWLEQHFDHTLLLDADDPLLPQFQELENQGACKLVIYEDVGMEGSAKFVFDWLAPWIANTPRACLVGIRRVSGNKNSAIYRPE